MTTGPIFPSYATDVTWTAASGAWSASYPLANVKDLIRISRLARASATGARSIGGVFSAARTIQALALVGHNVPAGAVTARAYLFSSTGNDPTANAATIVYDSGAVPVWPSGGPVEGLRAIRPFLLPTEVVARSIHITVGDIGVPLEIEAVEIGGFWDWGGISPNADMGIEGGEGPTALAGGGAYGGDVSTARIVDGQVDLMHMDMTGTTGLDFQRTLDKMRPFVWGRDLEDPASWARRCMLVRNQSLPEMVGAMYRHDRFPVKLIEHLR